MLIMPSFFKIASYIFYINPIIPLSFYIQTIENIKKTVLVFKDTYYYKCHYYDIYSLFPVTKTSYLFQDAVSLNVTHVACFVCPPHFTHILHLLVTPQFWLVSDHRRFAVFCVLKIGTQINDTTLLKDVDSSMTDLTFDDVIIL